MVWLPVCLKEIAQVLYLEKKKKKKKRQSTQLMQNNDRKHPLRFYFPLKCHQTARPKATAGNLSLE